MSPPDRGLVRESRYGFDGSAASGFAQVRLFSTVSIPGFRDPFGTVCLWLTEAINSMIVAPARMQLLLLVAQFGLEAERLSDRQSGLWQPRV